MKVIEIKRSGEVSSHIPEEEKESIVYLKVLGNDLNKDDCDFIRTLPYLQALDLSEADLGILVLLQHFQSQDLKMLL